MFIKEKKLLHLDVSNMIMMSGKYEGSYIKSSQVDWSIHNFSLFVLLIRMFQLNKLILKVCIPQPNGVDISLKGNSYKNASSILTYGKCLQWCLQ